ncbi:MAG: TIGR04282 family arsenosugar biosynthesis glycosyltransferase [Solirubrobacteraceae bacterium]|nr:TIGR04282 family arsenosugar biosynthesis glycosyltransferase [Solirubrobacteraceae bacterium]
MSAALVVLAKSPVAGRSKTRLCPPLQPEQAATLAEAALADTLQAVAWTPAARHVLVLDGDPGPWLPAGFELIAQRGDGLAERLSHAVRDVGEALLVLGMDTPQVTRALLRESLERLAQPAIGAVLGPAADGGYWAIGLAAPDPSVFDGVPMSSATTCAAQRARLAALGLQTHELPALRDVDTIEDAGAVSAVAPWTRFAATYDLLTG